MSNQSQFERKVVGAASILVCLLCWEILVRAGVLQSAYLPPPTVIGVRTVELIHSGVLLREMAISLGRIGVGFVLAVLLGMTLAVLCNTFRTAEYAISPLVELGRGIAPLALLPAFMLIFGIGFASKVAMILWVAWVPVFLNTLHGMQSVDPTLVKAARSIGSTRLQIAIKCILPSATPFILAGLRLGIGSAFLVLVAAEMLGANSGLGFYILETAQTFKIVEMYSAIVVIGLLGLALNWGFLLAVNKLAPWHRFTQ
jgi:NitT/TauT family transport system permease protein